MIRKTGQSVSILALAAVLLWGTAAPASATEAVKEVAQAEDACTGGDCPAKGDGAASDAEKPKPKVKTIKEFVKEKTRIDGLFPMYRDDNSGAVFLELSREQLGKEYIYYTYVHSGVGGLVGILSGLRTAGDMKDNYIVKFQRDFNEVNVVRQNTDYVFDADTPLARAQGVNNPDAVMAVLNVVAKDDDDERIIIAANPLFEGTDLFRIGEANPLLKAFGLSPTLSKKKTSVRAVRNYPENSSVLAEYVFEYKSGPEPASVFIQHNFTPMPEEGYSPRLDDPRVGFELGRGPSVRGQDPSLAPGEGQPPGSCLQAEKANHLLDPEHDAARVSGDHPEGRSEMEPGFREGRVPRRDRGQDPARRCRLGCRRHPLQCHPVDRFSEPDL